MSAMASQITGVSIVCSAVCSGVHQRKHQSSVSLAIVSGIHWWSVDSRHKGPVTRKMFPFDDVFMRLHYICTCSLYIQVTQIFFRRQSAIYSISTQLCAKSTLLSHMILINVYLNFSIDFGFHQMLQHCTGCDIRSLYAMDYEIIH